MKIHVRLLLAAVLSSTLLAGNTTWGSSIRLVDEGKLGSAGENAYIVKRLNSGDAVGGAIPKRLTMSSIPQDGGKFVQYGGEPIRDTNDLSARFAAGYDEEGLWIFVDVLDDQIRTVKGTNLWEGDSVQMSIDQSGRRMDYYDADSLEIGFALEGAGKQSWCWTIGRALTGQECRYDVRRTAKGYFLSARLSWAFLNKIDRVRKRAFAFNFIVNDNDGTSRKGWVELRSGIGTVKSNRDAVIMVPEGESPVAVLATRPTCVDRIAGSAMLFFMDRLAGKSMRIVAMDEKGHRVPVFGPTAVNLPKSSVGRCEFEAKPEGLAWGPIRIQCQIDGKTVQEAKAEYLPFRERIDVYKKAAASLTEKIGQLQAQGKPVRYPQSLLAVLTSQTQFARENLDDPDFAKIDLYLSKAIRRLRELDDVVRRLEGQVRELERGTNTERFKTHVYVTSPVELRDGYYYARTIDDRGQAAIRPVIFNGYLTLVEHGTRLPPDKLNELYKVFNRTGNNCIQYAGFGPYVWSYDNQHKIMNQTAKGEFVYDPAVVAGERVSVSLEYAYKNNLAVDFHLSVENVYPREITDVYRFPYMNSGFLRYQFDDPRARAFVELYLKSVVKDLKSHPYGGVIASFCLINEPIYIDLDITSDFQKEHFPVFLKERYQNDISALNRAYGTQFSDFGQVIRSLPNRQIGYENAFTDKDNRVLAYDWHLYKRKKFADWMGWMSDIVHKTWPGSRTQTKMMVFKSFLAGEAYNNVDPELFGLATDLNGNDNYFMYPGCAVFLSPGYSCDWLATAMNYDLQTSLKKVVTCNLENHVIEDHEQRDISYDHVYTALFQQFMHGMGFSATWAWNDQREGGYHGLYGLFPERPIAAAASGQVTLDANRLATQIKAFFDEKPKIAILYSPTSYLYEPEYSSTAVNVYKALNFLGYKIGFISERQIGRREFGEIKLIIAPNASHVLPATGKGLREWTGHGGKVISIGSSFVRDERDQVLEAGVNMRKYEGNPAVVALARRLRDDIAKTIDELPLTVTAPDGSVPDGVEWRVTPYRNGYLLNVVNYNADARKIAIKNKTGKKVRLLNLIDYTSLESHMTIEPLRPMLISSGGKQ